MFTQILVFNCSAYGYRYIIYHKHSLGAICGAALSITGKPSQSVLSPTHSADW